MSQFYRSVKFVSVSSSCAYHFILAFRVRLLFQVAVTVSFLGFTSSYHNTFELCSERQVISLLAHATQVTLYDIF